MKKFHSEVGTFVLLISGSSINLHVMKIYGLIKFLFDIPLWLLVKGKTLFEGSNIDSKIYKYQHWVARLKHSWLTISTQKSRSQDLWNIYRCQTMFCLFIHLVGPSSSLESSAFLSVSTGLSLIKNKIKNTNR